MCSRRRSLRGDGTRDGGVAVAKRRDADAAEQVEVLRARVVEQVHAFTTLQQDGVTVIGLQQQLAFPRPVLRPGSCALRLQSYGGYRLISNWAAV